jgi:hypothetical protein
MDDGRAKPVEALAEDSQPLSQAATAEIWPAVEHYPRGLARCMGVDDRYALH